MTREQYASLHLSDLKALAKSRGVKRTSTMRKGELIEALTALDDSEANSANAQPFGSDSASDSEDGDVRNAPNQEENGDWTGDHSDQESEFQGYNRPNRNMPQERREYKPRQRSYDSSRSGQYEGRQRSYDSSRSGQYEGRQRTYDSSRSGQYEGRQRSYDSSRSDQYDSRQRTYESSYRSDQYEGRQRSYDSSRQEQYDARQRSYDSPEGDSYDPKNRTGRIPGDNGEMASGILEVMQEGYGFLRSNHFQTGEDDVYVAPSQIRRLNLKTGDLVVGNKREKAQGERYGALLHVTEVNQMPPEEARNRVPFEKMTPIFPNRRISLERKDGSVASRIVDLVSPIGYGQRGMIVSPPKAGKTTLLKDIAKSILAADEKANVIILLIDERPEEVTDMRESVQGDNVDIIASTFDEKPENHKKVAEIVLERAKRLVEAHRDVIILLDSITRLTRAYNLLVPQSGRTLSGGLDPAALHDPKRFFGAARNMREGGSMTILATALVDTGSKMDDVVFEEFKGTGNMELILDRKLQERRIFPAVDIVRSGTRRDDLLLSEKEQKAVSLMRRRINGVKAEEAVESVLNAFARYPDNETVVQAILQKWQ